MSGRTISISGLIILMWLTSGLKAQSVSPAEPYGEVKLVSEFINNEMVYPEKSLKEGKEGTVLLNFQVNKDGSVKDLRVKKSVDPEIDAEAIRIFRMILWKPATKMGNPVASEADFPIRFDIRKYKRLIKKRDSYSLDLPKNPADTSYRIYNSKDVDQAPRPVFKDKTMNLRKFIGENIKYPEDAYKQSIVGTVRLGFIVETNGHKSNIVIEKPLAGGCSQEAVRLLELIHWTPGIKNGEAVRTRMHIEITFRLRNDNGHQIYDNSQISNY